MASPVLQFKRGAFANLPALRAGEPGFTTDKYDLYVGLTSEISTNKFFGSHRYWTRENGTNSLKLNLVDKGGTNKISIKSPDTLVGSGTYTLPDTNTIVDGYFLKVSADGTLSWNSTNGSGGSFDNSTLSGVTTVSGTLNATSGQINAGIVTVTDLYIDATRVLYNDGSGITLAGIQDIDATTKATFEQILAFAPNDFDNLNVTGIATVGGLIDANGGLDVLGHTEVDNLNVSGVSTFTGAIDANGGANISGGETILSSATVSDLTSGRVVLAGTSGALQDSANLTFNGTSLTIGTGVGVTQFSSSVSTGTSTSSVPTSKAVIDYVGTQIGNVDLTLGINADTGGPSTVNTSQTLTISGTSNEVNTSVSGQTITVGLPDNVTITGDLAVNGGDLTTSATTFNLLNSTATTVNAFGAATNLVMGAATGITTVRNNLTVSGDIRVNGNDIQASDGNTNITLTSNTLTTFAGDIKVTGNDIQASDGNTNITLTSNTLTTFAGDIKVTGNDIQSSTATALTLSGSDVTIAGDITVGGNDIKASNGTTALTLATTGAVTAANDLTVSGNLYVNGSTTQVNTTALTVEDRTIDLGIVNGAAPASTTTWDLGVLFNYNSGGAKKSAVIWEHGDSRFKFASVLGADTDGTTVDTPQLTVTTFAPIEVAELWVNNTCTGGSQQVIGCISSELHLQNIVVDAGTF